MPKPSTLTIHTAQGPLTLSAPCSVAHALQQLLPDGADPHSVATALNGQFIAREQRAQHLLADGDQLLCIAPITGG